MAVGTRGQKLTRVVSEFHGLKTALKGIEIALRFQSALLRMTCQPALIFADFPTTSTDKGGRGRRYASVRPLLLLHSLPQVGHTNKEDEEDAGTTCQMIENQDECPQQKV